MCTGERLRDGHDLGPRAPSARYDGRRTQWLVCLILATDEQTSIFSIHTCTIECSEFPSVQRAHHIVTFNNAELRKISAAVGAFALHDEVTEFYFVRFFFSSPSSSLSLVFSSPDSFNGETLEEVVEELVEFAFSPCSETATQEKRI